MYLLDKLNQLIIEFLSFDFGQKRELQIQLINYSSRKMRMNKEEIIIQNEKGEKKRNDLCKNKLRKLDLRQ
ncbi:unnamed protein product [Paramecium sonneborni]|uniref:Uncharacterized protein n=1 Tax=Paramecium sonneborni TaxID=65129 RepID=A0A8S1MU37_9CILI|nr:unnamed protein product [Paramecium sonneborni]